MKALLHLSKAKEVVVRVGGRAGAWCRNFVLFAALHLLEFHTLCTLCLINLPISRRACEADTATFISQMERQQCRGDVTGPRSPSESLG